MSRLKGIGYGLAVALAMIAGVATGQPPKPGVKGYEVEWVYRVKYGFIDEWWDLFRKYQIPILDRAKAKGYILDYRVYHPQFHTDEAARARWPPASLACAISSTWPAAASLMSQRTRPRASLRPEQTSPRSSSTFLLS